MKSLFAFFAVIGTGLAPAQITVTFESEKEGMSPVPASSVRITGGRLATIAVVGTKPQTDVQATGEPGPPSR